MSKEENKEEIVQLKKKLAEAEAQLRDKDLIFENILESSLAGYWDWYIQDGKEYLSPTFKSMFGYEDDELPNHPDSWQKIIHPEDLPVVFEIFNKHVETKGKHPYNNEVRYYHKNGSIVWVYCKGKVVEWSDDGKPIRMVGCHVNITPLKNALQEIQSQKDELENKNKELQEFTYIASHDLKEPLRTITSFIALLNRKTKIQADPTVDKYLKFITTGAARMNNLIDALLEYSHLGREKKLEVIDFNKLVKIVQKDLASTIEKNKVQIKVEKLPKIKGYKTEMRLVLQNIIHNAIKFRKKKVIPSIKISAEKKSGYYEFCINDNGIGLEKEFNEKIFMIFQRLNNKSDYEGSGIGLAHCKKVIDLHGGKIWVNSVPGVGSSFCFTLSAKKKKS